MERTLTLEDKEKISMNLSITQQVFKAKNPEKYSEMKRQAARVSLLSQCKRYKKNKIETIIEQKLIEYGLDFEYSVILGFKQYDFGNKEHRILLEVQGDYWHCNPGLYKIPKNTIQEDQIKKDILKKDFALSHNFAIFYIWEKEIKENNFKVLDEIKEYIDNLS